MAEAIGPKARLTPWFERIGNVDQVLIDQILAQGLIVLASQFNKFVFDLFLSSLKILSIRCSLRICRRCRAAVAATKLTLNRLQFGF